MFLFSTTPYLIIIALILVLLIALTISVCFIYYTKRKFDALITYKKGNTYKKAKKKLDKELHNLELNYRIIFKYIKKILLFLLKIRGLI